MPVVNLKSYKPGYQQLEGVDQGRDQLSDTEEVQPFGVSESNASRDTDIMYSDLVQELRENVYQLRQCLDSTSFELSRMLDLPDVNGKLTKIASIAYGDTLGEAKFLVKRILKSLQDEKVMPGFDTNRRHEARELVSHAVLTLFSCLIPHRLFSVV